MNIYFFKSDFDNSCKRIKMYLDRVVTEYDLTLDEFDVEEDFEIFSEYNVTQVPSIIVEDKGVIMFKLTGNIKERSIRSYLDKM